jgi:hypothetical protein
MSLYKSGLSTSKMAGGAKGVNYGMGKDMSRTSMSKLNVGKAEGNKMSHRPNSNGDPKGKSKS